MPVDEGFIPWCDRCGWNLRAPVVAAGRLAGLSDALARRLDERLAAELGSRESLEPRLTPAKAVAYAVAGLVHLFTAGLAVLGVTLLARGYPDPLAIAGGVLLLALAFLMRPRLGATLDAPVLAREDVPALYALADEVGDVVGARPDALVVDGSFNAAMSSVGVRRRRVVTLGLPLVAALKPGGLVAVLAHELAHARNGDATRGIFVGSAIRALAELADVPRGPPGHVAGTELGLAAVVARAFGWMLSRPLVTLLLLERHLLLRDSHRAEYLADALAARAAGTKGVIALHETLLLGPIVESAVHRATHAGQADARNLLGTIRAELDAVPARERERRRRIARLEAARLDATHPPTARRIELLERRRPEAGAVTIDTGHAAVLGRELERLAPPVVERLLDDYRASLYE